MLVNICINDLQMISHLDEMHKGHIVAQAVCFYMYRSSCDSVASLAFPFCCCIASAAFFSLLDCLAMGRLTLLAVLSLDI